MYSESLFKILLVCHIISGGIAFVVAPVALIVKKGGKAHRQWGKVFFWFMTSVAVTAAIMAPMHGNLFLTLVAVFSFYMAFSGYRSLYRKDFYKTHRTAFIDWFVASLNTIFSITLLVVGISKLPGSYGIISIVFGAIGATLGIKDIISFVRPPIDRQQWFFSHMAGMVGAYIAAVSAFSAVNLNFEWVPGWITWLWPSIIGVPLLRRWIGSYKKKFDKGRKIKDEVIVSIKPQSVE